MSGDGQGDYRRRGAGRRHHGQDHRTSSCPIVCLQLLGTLSVSMLSEVTADLPVPSRQLQDPRGADYRRARGRRRGPRVARSAQRPRSARRLWTRLELGSAKGREEGGADTGRQGGTFFGRCARRRLVQLGVGRAPRAQRDQARQAHLPFRFSAVSLYSISGIWPDGADPYACKRGTRDRSRER